MIEPGSVRSGDEVLFVYAGIQEIRRVERITSPNEITYMDGPIYRGGIIILDDGGRFKPDGTPPGIGAHESELFPLTVEKRQEIEGGKWLVD